MLSNTRFISAIAVPYTHSQPPQHI